MPRKARELTYPVGYGGEDPHDWEAQRRNSIRSTSHRGRCSHGIIPLMRNGALRPHRMGTDRDPDIDPDGFSDQHTGSDGHPNRNGYRHADQYGHRNQYTNGHHSPHRHTDRYGNGHQHDHRYADRIPA